MLSLLADEDFNGRIVRGLLRQMGDLDLVRAQDVGLQGAADEAILHWADGQNRVLLTHDARTMPREVVGRLRSGLHVSGVIIVDTAAPIGTCIDEILIVVVCSVAAEWRDLIFYLPMK
ncbi:MAG: DUF5615 family PIN-like protein [Planctomycetes bacterium]|nr:DUF5615 family PIN-like protein [Planctomycetota bacterium]